MNRNWQLHYGRLARTRNRTFAMRWQQGAPPGADVEVVTAAISTTTVPAGTKSDTTPSLRFQRSLSLAEISQQPAKIGILT